MLPKLISALAALLSIGELGLDAYVRVRKIFGGRKPAKLTDAEMRRFKALLPLYPDLLDRDAQDEFLDLENRFHYSREQ